MSTANQSLYGKNIRVKQSARGTTVVYQRGFLNRLGATVFGLVITAIVLWIMKENFVYFEDAPLERFGLFVLGSLVFIVLVFMANRIEFSVGSGLLVRRFLPMPRFYTEYPLTLSLDDLQGIGTDSGGGAIVAHLKSGKDVMLINNLPEADAFAMCQALHQHLGLPLSN